MKDFPVRLDGPSQISLFAYDNSTFIVESFLPSAASITVSLSGDFAKLRDLVSGEVISGRASASGDSEPGGRTVSRGPTGHTFSLALRPHSYRVFAAEK
jgi:hypothetical protein